MQKHRWKVGLPGWRMLRKARPSLFGEFDDDEDDYLAYIGSSTEDLKQINPSTTGK
jgi:hypothetical protein